jgi:hypothetical protein
MGLDIGQMGVLIFFIIPRAGGNPVLIFKDEEIRSFLLYVVNP